MARERASTIQPFAATGFQARVAADGSRATLLFTDSEGRTLPVVMPLHGLRAVHQALSEVLEATEGLQGPRH